MRNPIIEPAVVVYEAPSKATLKESLNELGLQEDVNIVEIDGFRWTLEYDQSPAHPDFVSNMLKLESKLQNKTKRPIDLRLTQKKDKNNRANRNVLWKEQ